MTSLVNKVSAEVTGILPTTLQEKVRLNFRKLGLKVPDGWEYDNRKNRFYIIGTDFTVILQHPDITVLFPKKAPVEDAVNRLQKLIT